MIRGAAKAECDSPPFMLESRWGTSYGMFNARAHAVSGSVRVWERVDLTRKPTAYIFIKININNALPILNWIYCLSYVVSSESCFLEIIDRHRIFKNAQTCHRENRLTIKSSKEASEECGASLQNNCRCKVYDPVTTLRRLIPTRHPY